MSSKFALFFTISLLSILAFGLLAGCDGSSSVLQSSNNGDADNQNTEGQQECFPGQHESCDLTQGNWVCTDEGLCEDAGPCLSDEDCRSLRPDNVDAICVDGYCRWDGSNPNDLPDSMGSCTGLEALYTGNYCSSELRLYVLNDSIAQGTTLLYYNGTYYDGTIDAQCKLAFDNLDCEGVVGQDGLAFSCASCEVDTNISTAAGLGKLVLDHTVVDFGAAMGVTMDDVELQALDGAVTVDSIQFIDGSSSIFSIENIGEWPFPVTLNAEDLKDLTLQSTSCSSKEEGTLLILSNSSDGPTSLISLRACMKCCSTPELELLPSSIGYGLVTLGCASRPETVTIYNLGEQSVRIESIQIRESPMDEFELFDLPTLPADLGTDSTESLTFQVKYRPQQEASANGFVDVLAEGDNTVFSVPLTGEGKPPEHIIDRFHQLSDPSLDILWVVDSSGSMVEERAHLAGLFMQEAVTWNANFHVAVTTMDMSEDGPRGAFVGDPAIIEYPDVQTADEAIAAFQRNIQTGTNSGADEQGFAAAHAALSPPMMGGVPSGPNDGFLRDDAKLIIIFVSDEDDQSTGTVDAYIDFFRSIKGARNTNMLEIYAIVGDPGTGCDNASPGNRYASLADQCNVYQDAHFQSICDDNWEALFVNFAGNLFTVRNQFFLSRLADESTITVRVNDVTTLDGWEYDDIDNSIVFDYDHIPPAGAQIEVKYSTICLH